MTLVTADPVELRAVLRAKIAQLRVDENKLLAMEEALSRANSEGWGARSKLGDSETALRQAQREAPQRAAYSYLNGNEAEADPIVEATAAFDAAKAEHERLDNLQRALEAEIARVQSGLRDRRVAVWVAMSDFIVASPQYQELLAEQTAAFRRLRSVKVALRVVGAALHGHATREMLEVAELYQPLDRRVGYDVDENFVEGWRSALEELAVDADTPLPNAGPSDGTPTSPAPRLNGNGHIGRPAK